MLIKKRILDQIIDGKVTLAFRRWKRRNVKTGGTLKTIVGVLDIKSVDRVASSKITKREAIQAGYPGTCRFDRNANQKIQNQCLKAEGAWADGKPEGWLSIIAARRRVTKTIVFLTVVFLPSVLNLRTAETF